MDDFFEFLGFQAVMSEQEKQNKVQLDVFGNPVDPLQNTDTTNQSDNTGDIEWWNQMYWDFTVVFWHLLAR